MKSFHITVTADRYPTEYTVQAASFSMAALKGINAWKKRFKYSHAHTLSVRIVKGI